MSESTGIPARGLSAAESERVRRRLADLVAFGQDAAYTVALGIDAYLADTPAGRVLRNNGRQILIQIATVVDQLPQAYKDARPEIDWVRITRMRNLIAHHYDQVDDELVFTALARRVPATLRNLGIADDADPTGTGVHA